MINEKIYIVNGCFNENEDEHFWVKEVFKSKEQAEACCLHLSESSGNPSFCVSEHEICNYDYVSLLKSEKEYNEELFRTYEEQYYFT